jgi:hypothetical protein
MCTPECTPILNILVLLYQLLEYANFILFKEAKGRN